MSISRRSLRKGLVGVGCVVGAVTWPWAGAGLLLLLIGSVLHLLTKATLQQNQILTTAGPYRWTRNPFYLANALIDAGIVCVIGQLWLAAIYAPIWWLAYRRTIQEEEAHLAQTFGAAFEDYRGWVPRFIPYRRPWPRARVQGRLSFQNTNLTEGREYARLLGIGLAPAAVWAAECLRREGAGLLHPDRWLELGGVAALPALWVVKLALAETFRRPATRLLPGRAGGACRGLLVLAAAGPLGAVLALQTGGVLPVAVLGAALFLGLVTLRIVRPDALSGIAAASVDGLAAALLVAGASAVQGLWLAVAPVLLLVLDRLDHWGMERASRRGERAGSASHWRYRSPVMTGTMAGLLGMGLLKSGWFF